MLLKELAAAASPLNEQQVHKLTQVAAELSATQLAWVSGYFYGISQQGQAVTAAPAAGAQSAGKLTILYASQTGNAKGVAEELKAQAGAAGVAVDLFNVADYKVKQLKKETHVLIVTSTNGEGEPPDDAIEFHKQLKAGKVGKLDGLHYGVLALGDSSYEFFCQTGKDFDEYLQKAGATPLLGRLDCDVDYEGDAQGWSQSAVALLKDALQVEAANHAAPVTSLTQGSASLYSKKRPFTAELITNQKITGRDSDKDIRHIEISLEDSGLTYQPGDALGVWFANDAALVDALLEQLGIDAEVKVKVDDEMLSIREALINHYELTQGYASFVQAYAELSGAKKLQKLVEDKAALREYCANHQILDIAREKKAKLTAEQLQAALRRLTPRLYSIASSQAEVDEEVHLTLGVVRFEQKGEQRNGGASSFLADRVAEGGQVRVFIEHNDNFRLPANGDTPVIMVGPGTGIAPFRAFMQEREAQDAAGQNWLFFGNPHFTQDFLYQTEWQRYVKSGLLSKVSLAFSRDQAEKVYVQHKLKEQGAEVYAWLEQGAHFYVCGDANKMAKDVQEALVELVAEHGNKSREQAEEYVDALRSAKRYQRDVY
ncbi:assimilatory sulfite reductase (NADPH) flavoprotein subunit [Oceanisphaera psychrotolerans]|uniref:Sulfite reductase [NADPH] flavoprotein alpha-component n=1 Tax=Oceanisphaera psychrotolerans TaxID=1414654 RepID=A0A1J4QDC4_9GAMM|nr:assimilatory sulfite reductase (NADPH) flavoprotein subunit [Oceanisphaera psychrotolerans]OIN09644.1 sulfite reductase [NADPH] flavoprotein, alpha-component [Oceanisphaera psychrotolerans]